MKETIQRPAQSSKCGAIFNVVVVLMTMTMPLAMGQVIGTVLCACSPATYTFRIDFDNECESSNIQIGNGISETTTDCNNLNSPGNTDFVPVVLSQIQVAEIGRDFNPVVVDTRSEMFLDESTFVYTSVTAQPGQVFTNDTLVSGLVITFRGVNNAELDIENNIQIRFSNECGIFPLFEVGQQIGWAELIDFSQPVVTFCPGVPTEPPSLSPVAPSTTAPVPATSNPTTNPTYTPSRGPSDSPSSGPSIEPSTPTPTPEPSNLPTFIQEVSTYGPTIEPSERLTWSPSMSPSNGPITDNPTQSPFSRPLTTNSPSNDSTSANPSTQPSIPCPPRRPPRGKGSKGRRSKGSKMSNSKGSKGGPSKGSKGRRSKGAKGRPSKGKGSRGSEGTGSKGNGSVGKETESANTTS